MAKAIPIAGLSDGVLSASTSVQRLMGWSVGESDGTPAVASFLLKQGGASGKVVAVVELAANGSNNAWFGPNGVVIDGDLYFDIVGGTVQGSVYVA